MDDLKYRTAIREKLRCEFTYPSDEFVSLIAKRVDSSRLTKYKRRKFKRLIGKELDANFEIFIFLLINCCSFVNLFIDVFALILVPSKLT